MSGCAAHPVGAHCVRPSRCAYVTNRGPLDQRPGPENEKAPLGGLLIFWLGESVSNPR